MHLDGKARLSDSEENITRLTAISVLGAPSIKVDAVKNFSPSIVVACSCNELGNAVILVYGLNLLPNPPEAKSQPEREIPKSTNGELKYIVLLPTLLYLNLSLLYLF